MKISKLFHWLYAILMLLPFAFFVPSVLYYAFNDNATMQNVEVEEKEYLPITYNQLCPAFDILDTTNSGITYFVDEYHIVATGVADSSLYRGFTTISCLENHIYLFDSANHKIGLWNSVGAMNNNVNKCLSSVVFTYQFFITNGNVINIDTYLGVFDLTLMFGDEKANEILNMEITNTGSGLAYFNSIFNNPPYEYNLGTPMTIEVGNGVVHQYVENTSIINYAWESIWDLPLFSWSKVTFVSVPFAFLTGIFGLSASNSINYVFGYFLTISIVWLVFDVIMYVPMLVHRWIDKARIE